MFRTDEGGWAVRVRRCGNLFLNAESEVRRESPLLRQREPASVSSAAISNEGHIGVRGIGRAGGEVLTVAGEPVLQSTGKWEREPMVAADQCGDIAVEFAKRPFGETTPRPVPPTTGWGLNQFRRAGCPRQGNPEGVTALGVPETLDGKLFAATGHGHQCRRC